MAYHTTTSKICGIMYFVGTIKRMYKGSLHYARAFIFPIQHHGEFDLSCFLSRMCNIFFRYLLNIKDSIFCFDVFH